MHNIMQLIKSKTLREKEQQLEREHDRIIAWVMEYCKDKDLGYQKSLTA